MSTASTLMDFVGHLDLLVSFFYFSTRALASTKVDVDDRSLTSTLKANDLSLAFKVDVNDLSIESTNSFYYYIGLLASTCSGR
jgi:hypothetical protein